MTGRHRFRNRRVQHTARHRAVDVVDARTRTRAPLQPTADGLIRVGSSLF